MVKNAARCMSAPFGIQPNVIGGRRCASFLSRDCVPVPAIESGLPRVLARRIEHNAPVVQVERGGGLRGDAEVASFPASRVADHAGDDAGDREVLEGIDRRGLEGVDLLGHVHRADLGADPLEISLTSLEERIELVFIHEDGAGIAQTADHAANRFSFSSLDCFRFQVNVRSASLGGP